MKQYYLAIDIGASSGRHILGCVEDGIISLREIYRFDNHQLHIDGHDCWDLDHLWSGILEGMKKCGEEGCIPVSAGIDTWGVDFVLLDDQNRRIGNAVAYRDTRTEGMDRIIEAVIPPDELYSRTGIQKLSFNTIYQLEALRQEHPEDLARASSLLLIPDYFHYLLTGVKTQEYTNATTTGLVNAQSCTWDMDLIRRLGFPSQLFGPLSMPGTVVGRLRPEVQKIVGYNTTILLPATHDTGSAFLAVPARDENAVFLSSGTWSLLGVENMQALTGPESWKRNFTNEGGAWHRFRFLKNIMGLWMIQSVRRELNGEAYVAGSISRHADGKHWSFPDLITAAQEAEAFPSLVDANDDAFLAPESMIDAIRDYCRNSGQAVPETAGEVMQCIYRSLSRCYRDTIAELSALTGKTYTSINIVGGGCQDMYLNRLTAAASALPVLAGPVEGTAIGNLIIQFLAGREFTDLQAARDAVRRSFDIKEVHA